MTFHQITEDFRSSAAHGNRTDFAAGASTSGRGRRVGRGGARLVTVVGALRAWGARSGTAMMRVRPARTPPRAEQPMPEPEGVGGLEGPLAIATGGRVIRPGRAPPSRPSSWVCRRLEAVVGRPRPGQADRWDHPPDPRRTARSAARGSYTGGRAPRSRRRTGPGPGPPQEIPTPIPRLPRLRFSAVLACACLTALVSAPADADPPGSAPDPALQSQLEQLVRAPGGPPGVIAVLRRGSTREIIRAEAADLDTDRPVQPTDHMRIASTAKAFSGAVALRLVDRAHSGWTTPSGDDFPRSHGPGTR